MMVLAHIQIMEISHLALMVDEYVDIGRPIFLDESQDATFAIRFKTSDFLFR